MIGILKSTVRARKGWILSPLSDGVFIFGGSLFALSMLFVAIVALFLPAGELRFTIERLSAATAEFAVFFILFALNGGHMVAGLGLLIFNHRERERILKVEKHLWLKIAGLFLVPMIFYGVSASLYIARGSPINFVTPIALMGLAYFAWNGWHFALQQFGLLNLYRQKLGILQPHDRAFDRAVSFLFVFIFPWTLIFSRGQSDAFLRHLLGSFQWLSGYRSVILTAMVVATCLAIFRITLVRQWRTQLTLCYLSIFFIPFAIALNPKIFIVMALLGPHYLQEIFLTSTIDSATRQKNQEQPLVRWNKLAARIGILVVLSAAFYHVWSVGWYAENGISNFGSFRTSPALKQSEFVVVTAIAAVLMGFNFLHYYLDRLIFSKRSGTIT
ncbi:hypothetical protein BH10BDE1_BH10BDE1_07660 [soil metagenome]